MGCKESNLKTKLTFKSMLKQNGYSTKTLNELYKWYDPTKKKGVASF